MVKEHVHTETFLGCSVKDFFEILYADGEAAKAFHKEADKDENTQVEKWEGNTRTVHFTMPMQLPTVLQKLIGTSSIPVKEVQQAEIDSSGALHITSTPIIGVPGGSKFQAVAALTVTNTSDNDLATCQVVAKVTCRAEGPWGLQGMIESIMVEQSAASVKCYLDFCMLRCQSTLAEQEAVVSSPKSDATAFDQFFDAQETISRVSSIASSQGLGLGPANDEIVDTVALLRLLDTLDGRIACLASDAAALRCLVPPRKSAPPAHVPSPALGLSPWLLGFFCGAFVVGATAIALKRHGKL